MTLARAITTADIRAAASIDRAKAEAMVVLLLDQVFCLPARDLTINEDRYSLNSVNGVFRSNHADFFFKFHQEEGEAEMRGEYYRADILANAGLPVDLPVYISNLPGEQILIYRRRGEPRFSDVLRALDLADDPGARARCVAAESDLNVRIAAVQARTLHVITPEEAQEEAIHRLFHERLVSQPERHFPGGRLADFYLDKDFTFPGCTLTWNDLKDLRFVINGQEYEASLGTLFATAHDRLVPTRLAGAGGLVAHGDAHNANIWYCDNGQGDATLAFFDPAFAGAHVPALLAEIKSTFHNIFAHPFWLYDPDQAAARFQAGATVEPGRLIVTMDWELSPIRRDLKMVKQDVLWRPLLTLLRDRDLLPQDWRQVMRLSLFLCPTLVMNLRAGATTHNPVSSLIGLAVAVMVGSEPVSGEDIVTRFLDAITPKTD